MSNPRHAKKSRTRAETAPQADPGGTKRAWPDSAVCLAIFVFAFALRLVYLFQIESIPVFYNLPGDPRTYDQWAQRIAAGDWLGQRVFYQAPFYPYFLALLQLALGHDLWAIRVAQIALSAASCSLLYLAGSSFFSQRAGIAAALILSLSAPAIFFGGLIDKTVVDPFLIALLLVGLGARPEGSRGIRWVAVGMVLGLLALSRENALVWVFLMPIWIWCQAASQPDLARLKRIGLFVLGLTLVLLPVGLRNLKVGGQFTLTTSQLGANFFIGNNPAADGTYGSIRAATGERQFEEPEAARLAAQALGRALSPREVSSYWLGRSWDYIRSQPGDWLRLMWKKWLTVWNVREIEDSDDFYLYQKWSWLLTFLAWFSHFGILAPLAAAGWLLTWQERRKLWLLYAMIGTFAFSVALFFVFGRYRFPLVPLLALFAGAGLVKLFDFLKDGRWREIGGCVAAALLTAAFVHWPVAGKPGPSATGYTFLANALGKQERIEEAIESLKRALEIDPAYGVAHYNLGNFYMAKGRFDDATSHYQQAIELYPRYLEAHGNLANLLAMRGELNEAAEHLREALKIQPDSAQVHLNLGKVLAAKGDLGQATGHFREAVRIAPNSAAAYENLALALAQQGKKEEASRYHEEAQRLRRSR